MKIPSIAVWTPPARWRSIDLISDLHLSEALPRTTQALLAHLQATDADAVLLLGDVFEVWVGDDQAPAGRFEAMVLEALAAAGRRLWLGWMHGNRDFLFGSQARARARLHLLPDPTVLQAFGTRLLLSHGDALCRADQDYQRFRRQVRSLPWQAAFLAQPLTEREQQARHIRQESRNRQSHRAEAGGWADVDADCALAWLSQARADTLVHGHTHRPGQHVLLPTFDGEAHGHAPTPQGPHQRWVLTDWDLDTGSADSRAGVLRWSARGLERLAPQRAADGADVTGQEPLRPSSP